MKRVWAEFSTPVGELRFGRMPNHWGLGILNNAGDGYDDNYQSTIDRIQFTTGIKPLDLYVTGAWDFVNEGATSDNLGIPQGQPYDATQLDDVTQYTLSVAHRKSRELTRLALAKGDLVINGGVQVQYRSQQLADDTTTGDGTAATTTPLRDTPGPGTCGSGAAAFSCNPGQLAFTRRGASSWTPDLWLQMLYKKFRFEMEAVTIQGKLDNNGTSRHNISNATANIGYKIRQYGLATELAQSLVEDKLRLGFNFGWASGDSDVDGLAPPLTGATNQHGDRTDSTFRFNPAYNVDLILYRNILSRVEGTYYFRPNVSYDFLRDSSGQKLGGGLACGLVARLRVRASSRARSRSRRRARRAGLLPVEGRRAQRRPVEDGRLLHEARVRRALPDAGPGLHRPAKPTRLPRRWFRLDQHRANAALVHGRIFLSSR